MLRMSRTGGDKVPEIPDPRLGPRTPIALRPHFRVYVRAPKGQMPPYTGKVLTDAEAGPIIHCIFGVPAGAAGPAEDNTAAELELIGWRSARSVGQYHVNYNHSAFEQKKTPPKVCSLSPAPNLERHPESNYAGYRATARRRTFPSPPHLPCLIRSSGSDRPCLRPRKDCGNRTAI